MKQNGLGFTNRALTDREVESIYAAAFANWKVDGKRVLIVIPDSTRSCPLDQAFRLLYQHLAPRAKSLSFLVALGTHPPMTDEQIYKRVGITKASHEKHYPKARFFNHLWKDPKALVKVGSLSRQDIAGLTGGLFEMDVTITCNRMVMEHDLVIIAGPVFPHEVVGFSGGNKYLFPGVAGQEIIDFFHWLGAVITNADIIGNKQTPVRKVVDRAAALLTVERKALCMVVRPHAHESGSAEQGASGETASLAGLYYGSPEEAWSAAANLSEKVHIHHTSRSYHTVLSCAPEMYDDLWTGGKCMYKLEPVVADGGKLIIYAPHIHEISVTHGSILMEVGYHTRDYFLKQWDKFKHYPWGVLAHSTHVKGAGTFDNGVEQPRVEVILATGISEDICRKVNLGYLDYRMINKADYENREADGILFVPQAGEMLYRRQRS